MGSLYCRQTNAELGRLANRISQAENALQQAKNDHASYRMTMGALVSLINNPTIRSELKCSIVAHINGDTVDFAISDLQNRKTAHFLYRVSDEVIPHLDEDGLRVRIWREGEISKPDLLDFFKFSSSEKLTHLGVTDRTGEFKMRWCNIHE